MGGGWWWWCRGAGPEDALYLAKAKVYIDSSLANLSPRAGRAAFLGGEAGPLAVGGARLLPDWRQGEKSRDCVLR